MRLENLLLFMRAAWYAALTGCALSASLAVRDARRVVAAVPVILREEVRLTRHEVLAELRQTRIELLRRVDRLDREANRQLTAVRQDVVGEVKALRADGNRHLDRLEAIAESEIGRTTASIVRLSDAYASIPDDWKRSTSQIWDCEANPDCLENRYVSVSRAIERASREVERSAPRVAASLEQTAANGRETTAQSTAVMKNLAEALKPLPRWIRIPLTLAAPAAQVAMPFVVR
ncbi:MAG: hypothetical protein ACKV22_04150 [Bryobacteraceae bacterium]